MNSCQVGLGQYPEDHFCEEVPHKLIKVYQGELEVLSTMIRTRNKSLEIPYTYMDPALVENSVAIWLWDGVSSSGVGQIQVHIKKKVRERETARF